MRGENGLFIRTWGHTWQQPAAQFSMRHLIIFAVIPLLYLSFARAADSTAQVSVYAEGPTVKCGFPQMLEAHLHPDSKYAQKLKLLNEQHMETQLLQEVYYSPSGHFKIYYSTSGYHAIPTYDRNSNGTPDYLEFAGKSFDRAWKIEIDSLGFIQPPDSSGVPETVYQVQCLSLGSSYYGQTVLDYEIPGRSYATYVTHIELNTNFNFASFPGVTDPVVRDSMAIAVTAAHEFNHALQVGYRLWEPYEYWFIESSATYMEEVVAPGVRDYLSYVPSFFSGTQHPLDESTNGYIDYGKVVFEIMLGSRYGKNITRKVWEQIQFQRALPALETVLDGLGSNMEEELSTLSLWMYFTGNRAVPGMFYPDAALYPQVPLKSASAVQETAQVLASDSLPRLSFRYHRSSIALDNPLSFALTSTDPVKAAYLNMLLVNEDNGEYFFTPAGSGYPLPQGANPDGIVFGVVNALDEGSGRIPYAISSRVQQEAALNRIAVSPQPLNLSLHSPLLTFRNVPDHSDIYIVTPAGRLIRTLHKVTSEQPFYWDLKNDRGDVVGSGVYLYRIESHNSEKTGKFVIIH